MSSALSGIGTNRHINGILELTPWPDDASLSKFLDPNRPGVYTHLQNWDRNATSLVKGVLFRNNDPNVSTTAPLNFADFLISVGQESILLTRDFVFGAPFGVIISNLTINKWYELVFYHGLFAGGRTRILDSDSGSYLDIDRGNSMFIRLHFLARSTSKVIDYLPFGGDSGHLYALSCYEYP